MITLGRDYQNYYIEYCMYEFSWLYCLFPVKSLVISCMLSILLSFWREETSFNRSSVHIACQIRRLNGTVLRMTPQKNEVPCHSSSGMITIPSCLMGAEQMPNFSSAFTDNYYLYEYKSFEREVK